MASEWDVVNSAAPDDWSVVVKEQPKKAKKPLTWGDVPMSAVANIPRSALQYAGGIYQAVRHPIDTAGTLLDAAAGGLRNATPDVVANAIDSIAPSESTNRAVKTADAVGQFYKDRYGGAEQLKNTLATDPVGAMSDASALFTGGAMLAPKGAAGALRTAANYTNPINLAAKAAKGTGNAAATIIGGLGTHTGAESVKQAARAGYEGGARAQTFTDNMRGNVPIQDVLEVAKSNLERLGQAKSAQYRAGMAAVSNDKSILDFAGIDKAIADARSVTSYKGQVKNARAAEAVQSISDDIAKWKQLDPVQFHTPEGLDALKQKIGGTLEAIPFEEKTARLAAGKIYDSIRSEIIAQAPVYWKVMNEYSDASKQITEIERALSLGKKAAADTSLRKLQSLTRNNATTTYGNRLDLANQLAQGGEDIMPALSGQALNSWTPRGLGGAMAGGLGLGSYALGGALAAIPTLALQSPRLVGELGLKVGQGARLLSNVNPDYLNALYQPGLLSGKR
jgi:hypothetical protein